MMLIKRTFIGITSIILLALPCSAVFAQTQNGEGITPDEINKINTKRNLVADKVTTKMEAAAIDSLQLLYELNEEDDLSPADELYDGIWNNQYIKAYSEVAIPDTFKIDLSNFTMPVEGKITSPFGPRGRRFHYGTDLKLQKGDTVYAAFEGKIRLKQYERKGYGYYLVIRHPNGLETVYGHLSRFLVDEGETVSAGQPIALGGNTGRSTGPHLHFECRFLGQAIDPADIVDFTNYCTYDDAYLFRKTNINAVSMHNSNYGRYNRFTAQNRSITYHRVQSGETLSKIAQRYRVTVSQICRLNGIQPTSKLKIGMVLRCS